MSVTHIYRVQCKRKVFCECDKTDVKVILKRFLQNFQQEPSYKNSGEIILVRYEYRKVYSFLDYIMGGLQLNCTIAIDFTGKMGQFSLCYCGTL